MTQHAAAWLVILLAFVAANLPFMNQRWLGAGPRAHGGKPLAARLVELVLFYVLVGAVGLALERYVGQNQPQGWEFYAVTATLFLTLAFPGFVYRYLVLRGR